MSMLKMIKGEPVPMYINGTAFVINDVITLRISYGGIYEIMALTPDGWMYRNGRAKAIAISKEEMDLILINWSDVFDHYSEGFCTITVQLANRTVIEYKN